MTDRTHLYVQYTSPFSLSTMEPQSRLLLRLGEGCFWDHQHDDPDLRWPSRQGISVHEPRSQ